MRDEGGPTVPELARRATLSSCRHDPVRALVPVLARMPEDRKEVTKCNQAHRATHHAERQRGHTPKSRDCNNCRRRASDQLTGHR